MGLVHDNRETSQAAEPEETRLKADKQRHYDYSFDWCAGCPISRMLAKSETLLTRGKQYEDELKCIPVYTYISKMQLLSHGKRACRSKYVRNEEKLTGTRLLQTPYLEAEH